MDNLDKILASIDDVIKQINQLQAIVDRVILDSRNDA